MDSKIIPIEEEHDDGGDEDNGGLSLAQTRAKFSLRKTFTKFYADFTYDNVKENARWFLESAAFEFSACISATRNGMRCASVQVGHCVPAVAHQIYVHIN